MDSRQRDRLRGVAGRRDRARPRPRARSASRCSRRWASISATAGHRKAGAGRRSAVRSDVGGLRPAGPARGDPRRRSGSVLPADRSLQRTLRGAQRAPRLVVPWQGLPGVQGDPRRARPRVREAPEDDVRGAARRPLGREPGRGRRDARQASATSTSRSARASASSGGSRAPRRDSSTATRTASCSAPMPIPLGIETPQQVFGEDLYRIYYRFLETEDEYFDYAPAPVPPQGRWRIYGLGSARTDPAQGLLPERRARARQEAGHGLNAGELGRAFGSRRRLCREPRPRTLQCFAAAGFSRSPEPRVNLINAHSSRFEPI